MRYKTMTGHFSYYVPGWDCHGLPIEQKVLQKLGSKIHQMSAAEIRRQCHDTAMKWVDVQREQFKRLGIGGDWAHPYLTLDPKVEAGILGAFLELAEAGLIYRDYRPVYWDPVYQTALAEAEIEYETHTSDSIYVKFPLIGDLDVPPSPKLKNVSIVIWTTTPWTLPANLAVCLHPDFEYVALAANGEHYIVAKELADAFVKACGLEGAAAAAALRAQDLAGRHCQHPIFPEKTSLVILGSHVTLEAGTGAVHTAPGHGVDDFNVGKANGLPVFVPVDGAGRFTADYPEMQGVSVFEANPRIIEKLRGEGLLLHAGKVQHQYPYSWRSHKPIIFRATEQWFMRLDEGGVRPRALEAIDSEVQWIPAWGRDRIYNMVAARPNWCLSRQRSWGVPIPAIHSKSEGKSILHPGIIEKFIEIVRVKGTDAWFTEPLEAFWPEGFVYEPTGENRPEQFEKEFDILDVWFDSGSTFIAVCEQREGLKVPVSLYLEGSDQHRGWFQSSLLIGIGARGRAPFEAVLTHGFVLDEKGEAMSKSKGNVISPQEIVGRMGADGLRLWVVSEDYRSDVRISKNILDHTAEAYRRIRNTFRFLIGNLYDFDPARDEVAAGQLEETDRWVLGQLNDLIERVTQAYESYEFHRIYHLAHTFCSVQLSALYLDIIKDRLYCSAPNDPTRRAAQTVCHALLDGVVRLVAPVLVFSADEAWEFGRLGPEPSVHLADFAKVREEWKADDLDAKWTTLLELRGEAAKVLEEARRAKTIGHSLDAEVEITAKNGQDYDFLTKNIALLKNMFIVSHVRVCEGSVTQSQFSWKVTVKPASGVKCERCWMIDPQVGENIEHPGLCPRCADVVKRIT